MRSSAACCARSTAVTTRPRCSSLVSGRGHKHGCAPGGPQTRRMPASSVGCIPVVCSLPASLACLVCEPPAANELMAASTAEYNSPLVATKPLVGATSSDDGARPERPALPNDIRQTRLLPSATQWRSLVRRVASMVALVTIDVGGLAGALYLAVVFRELYYGTRPILWGFAWSAQEVKWLPFLSLVTVLVFWRGGLYAPREQRAGAGRVVSSLLLVTVITLAFAVGTGYPHTTFGLYVTAFVLSVVIITGLRAAYELVTRDVWRIAGVRRRAVLLGSGERLEHLRRALGQ